VIEKLHILVEVDKVLFVDSFNVDKRNVPRLQRSQNVLIPGKVDSENILDALIVDDFEGVVVNP
jgi:hypothetical protein